MLADDYFGGAGGWDVACELYGITVTGYEILEEARRTRAAAGLKTSETIDVRDVTTEPGKVDLQLGSPPCQSFSMAGKGAGRRALDAVLEVVASYRDGHPMPYADAAALMGDERTALVVEPLRLALEGRPMFIAWEQVPAVLPVWEACADVLRRNGYSAVTALLNAEQYGVPQTRKRAILVARRDGREAYMPKPTHSLYYGRTPQKLDPGVEKWISMAEALGWGMTARPYPTVASGRTTGGPDALKVGGTRARQIIYDEYNAGRWMPEDGKLPLYVGFPRPADTEDVIIIDGVARRRRDCRSVHEPAPTMTSKGRAWYVIVSSDRDNRKFELAEVETSEVTADANSTRWSLRNNTSANAAEREIDQPAPTLYFGQHLNGVAWQQRDGETAEWPHRRPATTVMGDPRLGAPGHRDREGGERHHEKSIRITTEQAAILQSFPAGYPWQGSRTKQFLQIGNAIPPLLAYAIIGTFFDEGPVIVNRGAIADWIGKPTEQLSLFGDLP